MTLFELPDPPPAPEPHPPRRGRKWKQCEDCRRRIWAAKSLTRRFGLLLGEGCYRKRARAARRLSPSTRITVRPPGHIPGQLDLTQE